MTSGVYILRLKGEPVYVGKSTNVINRMYAHGNKEYDSLEIRYMPISEASRLEKRLINELHPVLNKAGSKHDLNPDRNKVPSDYPRICFRIKADLLHFVQSQAVARGISMSKYVAICLDKWLREVAGV